MNYTLFKNKYNWKVVNYDWAYGFQCVDLIRQYIKERNREQPLPLGPLWCKYFAISPYYYFDIEEYVWVKNTITNKPAQWDIVIFSKPYTTGHIALVDSANYLSLTVLEQNAWTGTWDWLWANRIKLWTYSYYNVMWWFRKRWRILDIK